MKDKYTLEDVPMILNSISWQLKRIADTLEKENQVKDQKPKSNARSQIRQMLDNLESDKN